MVKWVVIGAVVLYVVAAFVWAWLLDTGVV